MLKLRDRVLCSGITIASSLSRSLTPKFGDYGSFLARCGLRSSTFAPKFSSSDQLVGNNQASFNAALNQYRSQYPESVWSEIADHVLKAKHKAESPLCIDVVAGAEGRTGVALAKRGFEVLSVSFDAEVLSKTFEYAAANRAQISIVTMKAGVSMLREGMADLVTCMHDVHMFETRKALQEIHRMLKPGGNLVAAWNDTDFGSLFMRELEATVKRHMPSYRREAAPLQHDMSEWAVTLQHADLFSLVQHSVHPNPLKLSSAAVLGDLFDALPWVQEGLSGDARARLVKDVRSLGEGCFGQGPVQLPMLTKLYILEKQQAILEGDLAGDFD